MFVRSRPHDGGTLSGSLGPLVGWSTGPTSTEEVNLNNPVSGTYTVLVHGFNTDGPDANYTLFSWIGGLPVGNLTVAAPTPVTTSGTGTITASWSGLSPATKYLGLLTFRLSPLRSCRARAHAAAGGYSVGPWIGAGNGSRTRDFQLGKTTRCDQITGGGRPDAPALESADPP
jgi:hypothetical protein